MDKTSFRARWNANATPLFAAFVLFWYALRPVRNAVDWLVQDHPKLSPLAATAFEGIVLLIVAPVVLAALIYARANGCGRLFAQVRSFWMKGAKLGIACLLLILPGIILSQVVGYSSAQKVFVSHSRLEGWLVGLAWAGYLVFAPFLASPFLGFFQTSFNGSIEPSREEPRSGAS